MIMKENQILKSMDRGASFISKPQTKRGFRGGKGMTPRCRGEPLCRHAGIPQNMLYAVTKVERYRKNRRELSTRLFVGGFFFIVTDAFQYLQNIWEVFL